MPKGFAVSHLKAFIATRGPANITPYLAGAIALLDLPDFDALAEVFCGLVAEVRAGMASLGYPEQGVEAVIAGIDRNGSPRVLLCHAPHGDWTAGFRLTEVEDRIVIPGCSGDFADRLAARVDAYDAAFDPVRDGVALMEAQRQLLGTGGVGGFVELTTVTADAISTRVLHRWPDRVGDPVRPPEQP